MESPRGTKTGRNERMGEPAGGWPRGTHYEANEIAALRWVFATPVESAELAYSSSLGPIGSPRARPHHSSTLQKAVQAAKNLANKADVF